MNTKATKTLAVLLLLAAALVFFTSNADATWLSILWQWISYSSETCPNCGYDVSDVAAHRTTCDECAVNYYSCGDHNCIADD